MDFHRDMPPIPPNSLEKCTYRYLQKLAKSLGLPSNVKKEYLIQMIYAHKYCKAEQLASLISYVKEQRKLISKPRKTNTRLRRRLQGMEISSTSKNSPSICSTPLNAWSPKVRYSSSQPVKRYTNVNTLATKRVVKSDRVLRSYNNRSRCNYLNVERVVRVLSGTDSVTKAHEKQKYEWNMESQIYRPVRVANCLVQRLLPKSDNAHLLPGLTDVNQRQLDTFQRREEQVTPRSRSSVPCRRERRISGIYPLQPVQMCSQTTNHPGISNRGNRFNTRNAMMQETISHQHETMLKNKLTQTNIKKTPIVVSRTIQVKTMQNVYKSSARDLETLGLSNSSTDSARENSSDVETKYRMGKSFQDSFENVAFAEKSKKIVDYSIENFARDQKEMNRTGDFAKPQTKTNCSKSFVVADMNRTRNVAESQADSANNAKVQVEMNRARNAKLQPVQTARPMIRLANTSNRKTYVISNQVRRNNNSVLENKTKKTVNKMYGRVNVDQHKELRVYRRNPPENGDRQNRRNNLDIYSERNAIDATKKLDRNAFSNTNTAADSINFINSKDMDVNQNSIGMNMDRNEDYPNMSALTDVYAGNAVQVVLNEPETVSSAVYYHKKIRAEQVRTQRLSLSLERRQVDPLLQMTDVFPQEPLPHITDVFSKLEDPRFQHLAQPLYADCGEEAMLAPPAPVQDKLTGQGRLETMYNYLAPDLKQPLNFHHVITTTTTLSVYTSHFTTTAAVSKSTAGCSTCLHSVQVKPHMYAGSLLRIYEHQERGEGEGNNIKSDEASPRLAAAVPVSRGGDWLQDALELISQDGDYMERIGMGLRMHCLLCDWAGPKSILQYHIEIEHHGAVVERLVPRWSVRASLEAARYPVYELSKCDARLYVLHVACVGACGLRFRAHMSILPKDDYTESCEKYGRLTVYNRQTGEPRVWEGLIKELNYENDSKGLNIDIKELDLLPERDNLRYENGQWVVDSTDGGVREVCGDEIEIIIDVQIYN